MDQSFKQHVPALARTSSNYACFIPCWAALQGDGLGALGSVGSHIIGFCTPRTAVTTQTKVTCCTLLLVIKGPVLAAMNKCPFFELRVLQCI